MLNLSKPKRIVAIAIIIVVVVVPVYLAFNDQDALHDALSSLGAGNGENGLEQYTVGSARYNTLPGADVGAEADAGEHAQPPGGETGGDDNTPGNGAQQQQGGSNIMDSFRIPATPRPMPTPTPKWVPEYPITDGNLLVEDLIEADSVNVLIAGVDHSASLMDTIGVVSISPSTKTVKLIMFSRDLYIGYSDTVMRRIEKIRHNKLPGEYKLNNVYNVARNTEKYSDDILYNDNRFEIYAYDFLAQVIYEKFDIWVDDFVRLNTYGLVKLVDIFGGVRVYVPTYMRYNDPDQNLNINISKGTQVLNGYNAEGFVRFRQGYDSSGNLSITADRTKNQIAFLKAFYEQHAKLSNIDKIPDVISTLRKNIVHSVSMDDIFTKYVDILTAVVKESYEFEPVYFKLGNKRLNGSIYYVIEGVSSEPVD